MYDEIIRLPGKTHPVRNTEKEGGKITLRNELVCLLLSYREQLMTEIVGGFLSSYQWCFYNPHHLKLQD